MLHKVAVPFSANVNVTGSPCMEPFDVDVAGHCNLRIVGQVIFDQDAFVQGDYRSYLPF
jgi:hypothetical protein